MKKLLLALVMVGMAQVGYCLTVTFQQNATYTGVQDTYLNENSGGNHDTDLYMFVTNYQDSSYRYKGLVRFNITSLGAITVTAANISLYVYDSGRNAAGTCYMSLLLQNWVSNQATGVIYKTGSNWNDSMASASGTDYNTTAESSVALPASASLPAWFTWNFTNLTIVQDWANGTTNNGVIFWSLNGTYAQHAARSSDYSADLTLSPKMTIVYTVNGGTTNNTAVLRGGVFRGAVIR
jgi:hypothetical protein